jgi:hypothetical protein
MITKTFDPKESMIIVPETLRQKFFDSRVSREIFFLDALDDLNYCLQNYSSYNIIRACVILRVLLLDNGYHKINKNYQQKLKFAITVKELSSISSKELTKDPLKKFIQLKGSTPKIEFINLLDDPFDIVSDCTFLNKSCINYSFNNGECCFTVKDIINLLSNKHGAAHLDLELDSNDIEAFHLAEFNPLSISDKNFFLEKTKEIITVVVDAFLPLAKDVSRYLVKLNSGMRQYKSDTLIVIVKDNEK